MPSIDIGWVVGSFCLTKVIKEGNAENLPVVHNKKLAETEMPTNTKETERVGKALINALGFLSFLFGSFVLLAIAFGTIGGIFMSTKRLFNVKRAKRDKDNSGDEAEGRGEGEADTK